VTRRRGFTLLEVLAAIAVLAVVYTVLATSAMQGLANEGESYRRLRASLIADRELATIEAGLIQQPPDLGVTEREEGDYAIAIETRAFDLGTFAAAAQEGVRTTKPGGGESRASDAAFQLLTAPRDQSAPPLVEIQIAVRWIEGNDEQMVTRTTFASDARVVGPVVQALAGEQASAADGAGQPNPDESGGPRPEDLPRETGEDE
jgi:prepilin-type N-terminal cleavage/methylation domain-containing protein